MLHDSIIFFFSSRRRHTRWPRDWSSDVCSSDLCGPCRAIAPLVDQIAVEHKGRLKVGKLDVDTHQNVPQKYGVMSIPTLLLFKNGQVADQIVGAVPKPKLDAMGKRALGWRTWRQAEPD